MSIEITSNAKEKYIKKNALTHSLTRSRRTREESTKHVHVEENEARIKSLDLTAKANQMYVYWMIVDRLTRVNRTEDDVRYRID